MAKYAIGIDYGTLSGRALLVNVKTGEELSSAVLDYSHAVMDDKLPSGKKLGVDWALQHPEDYLDVLYNTIPQILKQSDIDKEDIIAIGTDFTACTILPTKNDGTPLCFLDEYKDEPHAYVKLWKHHAAQSHANKLNEIAKERKEKWLDNYGGKISSEWAIPKIWQVLDEAPHIYEAADRFIEAADWITWQLTGEESRGSCTAGYKEMWNKRAGYPSKDFFKALDERLENVVEDKLSLDIKPMGDCAGYLTEKMAEKLGLKAGIPVAVPIIDAHVFVPAAKIASEGKMLAIMGTSTCHMLLGKEEKQVEGMCGVVEDGILPGFFGYEAGQSCVGDHFSWFIDNCVPEDYKKDADSKGLNMHKYLREKAEKLSPGESGLVALDWWNGNRSCLVDVDLTGMMIGMTLLTKPEDIYRALIEATAFGTRVIVEAFRECSLPVNEFYAAGGIAKKDPMTMQIYADILNMPIKIAGSDQGGALGSAIFASVAAGKENGGYDSIIEAASVMGKLLDTVYLPIKENAKIYDKLYKEYKTLHDYFGKGENDVMKRLKNIKLDVVSKKE